MILFLRFIAAARAVNEGAKIFRNQCGKNNHQEND